MSQKDFSAAPYLKGEVCTQFIRCNKPGCRCRGGQTHGPYYYRVWREAGRVHKEYVKAENLAATRAACDAYRVSLGKLRDLRRRREQIHHGIHSEWRRTQRLLRLSGVGARLTATDLPPSLL